VNNVSSQITFADCVFDGQYDENTGKMKVRVIYASFQSIESRPKLAQFDFFYDESR